MNEARNGKRLWLASVGFLTACVCLCLFINNQAQARGFAGPTHSASFVIHPEHEAESGMGIDTIRFMEQAPLTSTVRLYGYVCEQGGGPVALVGVEIWDESNTYLGRTDTDGTGLYDIILPMRNRYYLRFTQWTDGGPYSYHKYVPVEISVIPGNNTEVRTDVAVTPIANIILELYDQDGNQVRYAAFSSISQRYLFATDTNDLPVISSINAAQDPYFHEHGDDFSLALPSLLVAPETLVRLHLQWIVPNFGIVILDLDNNGTGYQTPASSDYMVLNINKEAAHSEIARLESELSTYSSQGYTFSITVTMGLTLAQAAVAAGDTHMANDPPEIALAVADYDEALLQGLLAQETMFLEKADIDIPRYRKGTVELFVRTVDGQPIIGTVVNYQQTTHDFLFSGGNLTDGWTYVPEVGDLMQQMGVNSSAVNSDYGLIEPSAGVYDWTYLDTYAGLQTVLDKGFHVNGAVAYWDFPLRVNDCPDYWRDMTFTDYKQLLFEHFKNLAARYGTRIDPWMLNEQNTNNCLGLTWDQKLQVFQTVMEGLQAGYPEAQNLITSLAMPYGWSQQPAPTYTTNLAGAISFPVYLNLLRQHDLPIDNIGLELHFFGVTVPSDGGSPLPGMSLASMARLMDRYNSFEVPVWIEPFQVPSQQLPNSAWWHRPWDEATQAEFAVKFYTLAFSRQYTHDICWSDASDRNPFIVSAGLLDSDYHPKPAYYALKDLIFSWTTNGVGTTDGNGALEMMGFAGDYTITLTNPAGDYLQSKIHIHEQQQTEVTLTLYKLYLPVLSTTTVEANN